MKTEMVYSKRSILNKLNIGLYVIFQLLMSAWMLTFIGEVGSSAAQCAGEHADACMAGTGLGGILGISFLSGVWFVFGVIGALIIYITCPKIVGLSKEK